MNPSELLIGCGSTRDKRVAPNGTAWRNMVTLDINKDHKPDVVHDLTTLPYPFDDNTFSEIHAYEVMEHTGQQGDYKFFFKQFSELWRIMQPDGLLCMTCPAPTSVWAWGDPSHTRIVSPEQMIFLSQEQYNLQVGKTAMSDFRYIYSADFDTLYAESNGETSRFILKAVKPSRHKRP